MEGVRGEETCSVIDSNKFRLCEISNAFIHLKVDDMIS